MDGYIIGQEEAKIALSVAVYNHYKRIFLRRQDSDVELQQEQRPAARPDRLRQDAALPRRWRRS